MIKRPMFLALLVLILGESITFVSDSIIILLILAPVLWFIKIITKKQAALFVMIFLFFAAGFFGMKHSAGQQKQISKVLVCRTAEGAVSKITATGYGWNICLNDVWIGRYHFDRWNVLTENVPQVKIGQKIRIYGTVSEYSAARNFGNFDAKNYYRSLGIFGKIEAEKIQIINSDYDGIRHFLFKAGRWIENRLKTLCSATGGICSVSRDKAGLFSAMLLGDRTGLDENLKSLYSSLGIAHILAISGLHISLIGLSLYRILRKKFGFGISASVSLMIVTAFCIMSGMSVATTRALLMFSLKLLGEVSGRKYDALTAISFAGILLLLGNPQVWQNSGFQMSFVAMIAISIVFPMVRQICHLNRKNVGGKAVQGIFFSLTVTVYMNPLVAFYNFELPTYAFLLNLVVVPLMSVVMFSALGALMVSFLSVNFGRWVLAAGSGILESYTGLCNLIRKLPVSNIIVGKPPVGVLLLYYGIVSACIGLLYAFRLKHDAKQQKANEKVPAGGRAVRGKAAARRENRTVCRRLGLALVTVFVLLNAMLSISFTKDFQAAFLDVGQGDGIYIRSDNGASLLVDGGSSSVEDVGKNRMIPFLKAEAVRKIEYAVVTHTDADHINGLMELLENSGKNQIRIGHLVLPTVHNEAVRRKSGAYEKLIEVAERKNIPVLFFSKGDTIRAGSVQVRCIYPNVDTDVSDINGYSVVLSVTYKKFSMLLTGDISSKEETQFSDEIKSSYTVLKVAHHGSKYSTCEEFLNRVNPRYSIISVGENNRYGHPSEETLMRLQNCQSTVMRTDRQGGISITGDGVKMQMQAMGR